MISFAVTAKLICVFVFAYADCWFSHEVAQIMICCKVTVVTFQRRHIGVTPTLLKKYILFELTCKTITMYLLYEPHREKTRFLPMRKQRRRSASQ